MRITENQLAKLTAEINSLESKVHPIDSTQYRLGNLWSYDYFGAYGVYIRRGLNNPLYPLTNKRVTIKEAYLFLLGIKHALAYDLEYTLQHS